MGRRIIKLGINRVELALMGNDLAAPQSSDYIHSFDETVPAFLPFRPNSSGRPFVRVPRRNRRRGKSGPDRGG